MLDSEAIPDAILQTRGRDSGTLISRQIASHSEHPTQASAALAIPASIPASM